MSAIHRYQGSKVESVICCFPLEATSDGYGKGHLPKDESVKSGDEASYIPVPSNASEPELSALDELLLLESGKPTSTSDISRDGDGNQQKEVFYLIVAVYNSF